MRRTVIAACVCVGVWIASIAGQQPQPAPAPFVADELLVKFHPQAPDSRRDNAIARANARRVTKFDAFDIHHLRVRPGANLDAALAALRADSDVVAVAKNYLRSIAETSPPNDPSWLDGSLWGLTRIQAQETWQAYGSGTGTVVVADIDTGVDYNHPDLAANMWRNPGETGATTLEGAAPNCTSRGLPLDKSCNNRDDDSNGYIDDVYGIDTVNNDTNPMDDHGHGTHTSGTLGAVGNNGLGVTGVNWNVKILACKFIAANGFGPDSAAIGCFNYITNLKNNKGINIRVSNNSWGGTGWNTLLMNAIDNAGTAGIVNMFAAGNSATNNDVPETPFFPSSYPGASIVAVAASDRNDGVAWFSNYGATTVDLAAPGVDILSTTGGSYAYSNGTSMATPHVAGAAALLLSLNPNLSVATVKSLLMNNADPIGAWAGKTITGGRLNLFRAAQALAANPAPSVTMTSPADNSSFATNATVTLAATATDSNGSVTQVQFYRKNLSTQASTLICTDTSSPYGCTLSAPQGNWSLTAVATDDFGATATSAAITIAVGVPAALLTPTSLTFGAQALNTQSAAQTVQLKNTGATKLVISSFNGVAPTASFTTGDYQVTTTCPLTGAGLAAGATCTFTVKFTPTSVGTRTASIAIGDNAFGSPHTISLTGTGGVVTEPTARQAAFNGAMRIAQLQRPDGGWYFHANDTSCNGSTASCYNTLGITAQGMVDAYNRSGDNTLSTALTAASNRLVQRYNDGVAEHLVPKPFSQDLEFLSWSWVYSQTAHDWFLAGTAGQSASAKVDQLLAERGIFRTVAAWDVASLIRDAISVGEVNYALEAANRIVALESQWKDTNRAHRYDACGGSSGCGPADNPYAYDYTLLAEGSLLWAFHDLPVGSLDAKISEYRAFLIQEQDAVGSWDVEDLQITAYAMLGLEAVGGAANSLELGAAYLLSKQNAQGGWPAWISGSTTGAENIEIDAEIVRALQNVYNTVLGTSVSVAPAQLSSVSFATVSQIGATTVVAKNAPAPAAFPGGISLVADLNYEVNTTAAVGGDIRACFTIPWNETAGRFADLRILHAERGAFVDRTILTRTYAPDPTTHRVCALVTSLGAFAVGLADATPSVPGRMLGAGGTGNGATEFDFAVAERASGAEAGALHFRTRSTLANKKASQNQFDSTAVTAVSFYDVAGVTPGRRPPSGVDTVFFSGVGLWNGAAGYTFTATAVDAGEPGRDRDTFAITIRDSSGAVVSSADGIVTSGNIQSLRLPGRR